MDESVSRGKSRNKRKWLIIGASVMVFLGLLGVWVLVNPQNPFTGLFRSDITDDGGRVVRGPYPTKEDFKKIEKAGVTTIVSLLDPRLPYEAVLLEQERKEAEKYDIKVLNFPMASVLGQRLGDDYKARVTAAADSIQNADGKVYLHCYLGVHRARDVEKLLRERGITTDEYAGGEKDSNSVIVENAELLYGKADYKNAVVTAALVADKNTEFSKRASLVKGWSHYQLGQHAHAYETFRKLLLKDPTTMDGNNGLAYSALQLNDHATAERHFNWVIANEVESSSAYYGLANSYMRQGKPAEARKYAELALKYNPKHEEAQTLLQELATR